MRALITAVAAAGAIGVAAYLYQRRKRGAPVSKKAKTLKEIKREDYTTPPISISTVNLVAKLDEPKASRRFGRPTTIIEATLGCSHSPSNDESELVLHAEELDVLEVAVSHEGGTTVILSPGRHYSSLRR